MGFLGPHFGTTSGTDSVSSEGAATNIRSFFGTPKGPQEVGLGGPVLGPEEVGVSALESGHFAYRIRPQSPLDQVSEVSSRDSVVFHNEPSWRLSRCNYEPHHFDSGGTDVLPMKMGPKFVFSKRGFFGAPFWDHFWDRFCFF